MPLTRFQVADLGQFLAERQTGAAAAVNAVPDEEFQADPDGVVQWIYEDVSFEELQLGRRDEFELLRGRDPRTRRNDDAGVRVEIRIPFSGPAQLWGYQPALSLDSGNPTSCELKGDHFLFIYEAAEMPPPEQVKRALDKDVEYLQTIADGINSDVRNWLPQLRILLDTTARERKGKLVGMEALGAALGIRAVAPERRIPIAVQRKPLRPVAKKSSSPTAVPQQFLQDDVYQDVLRTIEQMSRAMERTPTAARFGEEELRNLILIVLNANYEGAARGEVFNGRGKTDLLLTWEGENAFIGECKQWSGPSKFSDGIDQLLSYVTWRYTKAALVLFIKRGDPTQIIRKARDALSRHPSFVHLKPEVGETRVDYVLRSPSDPERLVEVALIAVVMMPERVVNEWTSRPGR